MVLTSRVLLVGVALTMTLATYSELAAPAPLVIDAENYQRGMDSWQQSNNARAKAIMDADYEAWQRGEKMRTAGCVLTREEAMSAIESYMSNLGRYGMNSFSSHSARFLRSKPECADFF